MFSVQMKMNFFVPSILSGLLESTTIKSCCGPGYFAKVFNSNELDKLNEDSAGFPNLSKFYLPHGQPDIKLLLSKWVFCLSRYIF